MYYSKSLPSSPSGWIPPANGQSCCCHHRPGHRETPTQRQHHDLISNNSFSPHSPPSQSSTSITTVRWAVSHQVQGRWRVELATELGSIGARSEPVHLRVNSVSRNCLLLWPFQWRPALVPLSPIGHQLNLQQPGEARLGLAACPSHLFLQTGTLKALDISASLDTRSCPFRRWDSCPPAWPHPTVAVASDLTTFLDMAPGIQADWS